MIGELLYMDDKENIVAVENWKTSVKRYLDLYKTKGIAAKDITSFAE